MSRIPNTGFKQAGICVLAVLKKNGGGQNLSSIPEDKFFFLSGTGS
jgi:hypothetical protein